MEEFGFDDVEIYSAPGRSEVDKVFGQGACSVLKIRKYGGMKVL